jgi:hypothetical protein
VILPGVISKGTLLAATTKITSSYTAKSAGKFTFKFTAGSTPPVVMEAVIKPWMKRIDFTPAGQATFLDQFGAKMP